MMPWILEIGSASRSLPTVTGDPGNAFLVYIADQAAVPLGSSKESMVKVMDASSVGSSCGENLKVEMPAEKPDGKVAWF